MEDMDFKHLHVEFFMDTKENKRATAEAGRPIFEDVEKVRIRMAGDRGTVLVAPAHSGSSVRDRASNRRLTYAQLHEGPYKAFKANVEYTGEGTPLKELPFISNAKAKELQALNIHTAEALAGLDGEALKRAGMGSRELKDKAAVYIDKAKGAADISEYTKKNDALQEQITSMQAQMEKLLNAETPQAPNNTPPSDVGSSPFKDWADEDIGNWIVDNGGEKPHHKCSHETLVQKADALNAKLREAA